MKNLKQNNFNNHELSNVIETSLKKNSFLYYADIISYVFFSIFAAECVLGSSGRWLMFGPLSIRMLLFSCVLLLSIPMLWSSRKYLFKNAYFLILSSFFIWIIICTVIGYLNGNALKFIRNDLTGFLTFALIPSAIVIVRNKKRLLRLTDIIFYSSVILAVVVVFIHYTLPLNLYDAIKLDNIIQNSSLGGLTGIGHNLSRIYFRSEIFFQLAILIGIWKIIQYKNKFLFFTFFTSILCFALILSYTRGFWIGCVLGLILMIILSFKYWKIYLKSFVAILVGLIFLMSISWYVYSAPIAFICMLERFDTSLIILLPSEINTENLNPSNANILNENNQEIFNGSKIDQSNAEAATIRANSLKLQLNLINEKPFFGWGLGKNLDTIRDDGRTEYMYWDISMKMGLIGLALFLLIIFYYPIKFLYSYMKQKIAINSLNLLTIIHTAGFFGVALTSYVNPYITSPMGSLIVIIVIVSITIQNNTSDKHIIDSKE